MADWTTVSDLLHSAMTSLEPTPKRLQNSQNPANQIAPAARATVPAQVIAPRNLHEQRSAGQGSTTRSVAVSRRDWRETGPPRALTQSKVRHSGNFWFSFL